MYLLSTIYVSAEGKVPINQLKMQQNDDPKFVRLYQTDFRKTLDDPEMVYLKYNDNKLGKRQRTLELINEVLEKENKEFIVIKTFDNWKGDNHITIYKAVKKE